MTLTTQSESVPLVEAMRTLVVGEPVRPGEAIVVADGLDGAGAEGYGFCGVGDVGVEGSVFLLRCGEAELAFCSEVERN